MIIFNITFLVSEQQISKWLKWIKEEHIPYMLSDNSLISPQIAKVISQEEQDGVSYSVQYKTESIANLNEWYAKYGYGMEESCVKTFGESVLFFSTILEVIE
jgi:hypothetical protein